MVKYTVQNDLHASSVDFCGQFGKQFIAGFQILLVCHSFDIFPCMGIVPVTVEKNTVMTVLNDSSIMWIYIVIILTVIFMVTRRHKDRVQINNLNSQILHRPAAEEEKPARSPQRTAGRTSRSGSRTRSEGSAKGGTRPKNGTGRKRAADQKKARRAKENKTVLAVVLVVVALGLLARAFAMGLV